MELIREGFQKEVSYTPIFEKTVVIGQQRRQDAFQELEDGLELAPETRCFQILVGEERMA